MDFGVCFDSEKGEFKYTKEGAHSVSRIVHNKDETGKELFLSLLDSIKNKNNIRIYENTTLLDIIINNNKCIGGIVTKGEETINIYSKETILATGGIGGLFKNSTSRRSLTGDGIAIALRHNIVTSGNVTTDNILEVASSGVDYISVGALTHSYKVLDLSMKNLVNS
nr:FAD-binding protein [Clostridium sp.]